jgi:hypothetical protein
MTSRDLIALRPQEEGVLIQPLPRYVIKTKVATDKLFVNVTSSEAIAVPSTKKRLDAEGKEIEGMNVPVSVGSLRSCTDKAGKPSLAIDVIVSPKIISDAEPSPLGGNRDFLNQFILQCVEQKCNTPPSGPGGLPLPSNLAGAPSTGLLTVDRKYTLPKLSYQGYVHSLTGLPVNKASEFAEVAKQTVRDVRKQPTIEEVEPPRPAAGDECPAHTAPRNSIECSVSIETVDGSIRPLEEFIEATNASLRGDAVVTVEPALSAHSRGSLVLMSDPSKSSHSAVQAKMIHLECQLTGCPDPETMIRVDASAYAISVSLKGLNPTECIIPLPIETGSTTCSYNAVSSSLTIKAAVLADDATDRPDIGSHPWMLQKGLSVKKENAGSEKKKTQQTAGVQEQQKSGAHVDDGNDDEDIFPEDRFHAQDAYSQHMLLKQREEQQRGNGEAASGNEVDNVMELF